MEHQRKPKDRRVNSLLRDIRELEMDDIADTKAYVLEGYETHLQKRNVVGAWSYLQDYGRFFCEARGPKQVLEGNVTAGWLDIEQSTYYSANCLFALPQDRLCGPDGKRAGHVLGHSILLEWWEIAERMARILVDNLRCDNLIWRDAFFHFFTLAMWGKLRPDSQAPKLSGRLGVYQKIMDAWTDDERLAETLKEAIEYHLQNTTMFEDSDEAFTGVWELAPLEIELIRKVRSAEGLSMPAIEHPLLETPFAQIPGAPSRYRPEDDPLAQQALALTRELRPEIGL